MRFVAEALLDVFGIGKGLEVVVSQSYERSTEAKVLAQEIRPMSKALAGARCCG